MKLNRHQIAGRIVEDPEYGSIPGSGIPTIKLRVMTDDGWYDTKKSEYVKRNSYHTVKKVGKDVDNMELRQDDWVYVEGQLLTDSWEDRDGNKKYATFIRAQHIVEIPDPWEKRDTGGGGGNRQRDDRGSSNRGGSRRDDRRDDRRDSRRDDSRDSRQSNRGGGRDRDTRRDVRGPDDDIPF